MTLKIKIIIIIGSCLMLSLTLFLVAKDNRWFWSYESEIFCRKGLHLQKRWKNCQMKSSHLKFAKKNFHHIIVLIDEMKKYSNFTFLVYLFDFLQWGEAIWLLVLSKSVPLDLFIELLFSASAVVLFWVVHHF